MLEAVRLFHLAVAAGARGEQIDRLDERALDAIWQGLTGDPTPVMRRAIGTTPTRGGTEATSSTHSPLVARRVAQSARPPATVGAVRFLHRRARRVDTAGPRGAGRDLRDVWRGGLFWRAIDYQGLYDTEPAAHCPVVMTPAHEVREAPIYTAQGWHDFRQRLRAVGIGSNRGAHRQSRTLSGGWRSCRWYWATGRGCGAHTGFHALGAL